MTKPEIEKLISGGTFPGSEGKPQLLETHISWVLLSSQFVFKIKKPIVYSFLDFSTLEKRQYFCEKEIGLNKRLTSGIYLDVWPVASIGDQVFIAKDVDAGVEIIDYAVRMNRVDGNRQMDKLLLRDQVTQQDITRLAEKIALFHSRSITIHEKDVLKIREEFADLEGEKTHLADVLSMDAATKINRAINVSDSFIRKNQSLFSSRLQAGWYRDCHGDLHSRNIFLLEDPQPFDCIEFNDEYRQIDVLNEVAFLCMDLDAFGRQDLSDLFIRTYNEFFPVMTTPEEVQLFIYYKSYRANVRAKVNSLRLRSSSDPETDGYKTEIKKYLGIMDEYIQHFNH